jgi:5-methylcytosine-specific restriction endonuclease McrA
MKQHFLASYPDLILRDPSREFDYFEKVVIYRRDKGICQSCGKAVEWKDYEADHIYPHVKGGQTRIENGQVLCGTCNASKGAKTID